MHLRYLLILIYLLSIVVSPIQIWYRIIFGLYFLFSLFLARERLQSVSTFNLNLTAFVIVFESLGGTVLLIFGSEPLALKQTGIVSMFATLLLIVHQAILFTYAEEIQPSRLEYLLDGALLGTFSLFVSYFTVFPLVVHLIFPVNWFVGTVISLFWIVLISKGINQIFDYNHGFLGSFFVPIINLSLYLFFKEIIDEVDYEIDLLFQFVLAGIVFAIFYHRKYITFDVAMGQT